MSEQLACSKHNAKVRPWRLRTTPWTSIVTHEYDGQGTAVSPYLVTWLASTSDFCDVDDPTTFNSAYSWALAVLAGGAVLAVSMGSSMLSAAIPSIMADFPNHNSMIYILITGIYVCGFIVGPLLWSPMSELYGRRATFIWTYIPFVIFAAACCASQNITTLLVLRFWTGMFGASAMTNSGGVIADVFDAERRGLAMAIFAIAPFMGPAIGPVASLICFTSKSSTELQAGGFLGQYCGWRWVTGVIALFAAVITLAGILFLPETYSVVLLRARAAKLSKVTGMVYRSKGDIASPPSRSGVLMKAVSKPWGLLFGEPIVGLMAAYLSVVYALLYMQFTAFPIVFTQTRGWSPAISGLAFVGITVGSLLSLLWIIFRENPRYSKISKACGGFAPPEERLVTSIAGAILLPISLIMFAWTGAPASVPWIVPIIATVLFGISIVFVFLGVSNYLVDSYLMYAASALAGNAVCRSILGVVFPLFTSDMYRALGVNWAGTLVAGLALIFTPVPFVFYRYGQRIRRATKASRQADDLAQMMRAKHQAASDPRAAEAPTIAPSPASDPLTSSTSSVATTKEEA